MKHYYVIAAMVFVVGIAGFVTSYGAQEHVFFQENLCGIGKIPVLSQQTVYGTGKTMHIACVPQNTMIGQYGATFPALKQRWKTPGGRISY